MNKMFKILWKLAFVLMYPIITAFSLLFTGMILFFSALSKMLNRLSTGNEAAKPEGPVKQVAQGEQEWKSFLQLGDLELKNMKVDEVLFGPAYFKLHAVPRLPELDKHFWGQFNFPCFNGTLLQKWQSVKEHELEAFDLVYFDPVRKQLKKICTLPTYDWQAKQLDAERVLIEWFNGKEQLIIRAADLA
jgi:hypothetical protein